MSSRSISIHHTRKRIKCPFHIAIPCFQESLPVTVLTTLQRYHIPYESITLFLSSSTQETEFRKEMSKKLFGRLVRGGFTYREMLDTIFQVYAPGTPVIIFSEQSPPLFQYSEKAPSHKKSLESLLFVFQKAFELCREKEARCWGIVPLEPGKTLSSSYSTRLKRLCSAMWGCIIPMPHELAELRLTNPGDSEGFLQHRTEESEYTRLELFLFFYKQDHALLRLQWIGAEESPLKYQSPAIQSLCKKYPDYFQTGVVRLIDTSVHNRTN